MRRLLPIAIALACCAPAYAAEPAPARLTIDTYTGTVAIATRGERREFITARATAAGPLLAGVNAFARVDLTGQQDGGSLSYRDPKTFRTVEGAGGLWRRLGPVDVVALGGVTWSAEGEKDAPLDARLFTAAALARIGFGDGGYVYAGGGHHGPVGGPALLFSASVPIKGAYTVTDFAFPLRSTVFQEKAWVLKVGAQVRVKRLRLW